MKLRTTLTAAALIGSAGFIGLGGVALASFQGAEECADGTPAVSTDGLEHYAGVCAGGYYLQINELGGADAPLEGGSTAGGGGGAPTDALPLPEEAAGLLNLDSIDCDPPAAGVQVYTDGLAHTLGVCDDSGNTIVEVGEIAGALEGRNSTVVSDTPFARIEVNTQAGEQGTDLYVINPSVDITPKF